MNYRDLLKRYLLHVWDQQKTNCTQSDDGGQQRGDFHGLYIDIVDNQKLRKLALEASQDRNKGKIKKTNVTDY